MFSPGQTNSTLLDGVGLRGQTIATCCAVQTRIVEIRDLGRITIPNVRSIYPLPLPERWLSARGWMQQCWIAKPNKGILFTHKNKRNAIRCCIQCWMEIKFRSTSYHIIQHDAMSWCNMVAKRVQHVAFNMSNDVGPRCCTCLATAVQSTRGL